MLSYKTFDKWTLEFLINVSSFENETNKKICMSRTRFGNVSD